MQKVNAHPPGLDRFPFFVHEDRDVFISAKIRKQGVWEEFETQLLLALLGERDQVIDIGANIGWYTVAAGRRTGPTGHVFAFEPDRRNFQILTANIRQSGLSCVSAEQMALGRGTGKGVLRGSADNQGDLRVRQIGALDDGHPQGEEVAVAALDDYLASNPRFDISRLRILKMDVQGFEHEVLLGAQRLLAALPTRTVCFVEFDPVLLADNSDRACHGFIDALAALSRRILMISRPVWCLREISIDRLRYVADRLPAACYDLIVAHDSALPDLRRALPLVPRWLSSWAAPSQ